MRILNFGINDITDAQDGLPEYLKYFSEWIEAQGHDGLFINVRPCMADKPIEEMKVSKNIDQVLINIPNFFEKCDVEVLKYIDMFRAGSAAVEWKPDLVIMHDWMFAPVVKAMDLEVPVIYFNHLFYKGLDNVIGGQSPISIELEGYGMHECADYVFTNSHAMADEIAKVYPQLAGKVYPIQLGVNKKKYAPCPNLKGNTILYLGRLAEQKGIGNFLNEVKENKEAIKKAGLRVVVAGAGDELQRVVNSHYDGDIEYIHVVKGDKKMKTLRDAKYMVFPSLYEPWGLSLGEGLSCGKICIVSPAGGHREQVKNNKNGRIANPGQYISSILEFEKNPGFQKKLSLQATKRARDISEHFKELGGLFHDLLGVKKTISGRS